VMARAAVSVSMAPLSRPAAAALRCSCGLVGVRLPAGPASAWRASRHATRWACESVWVWVGGGGRQARRQQGVHIKASFRPCCFVGCWVLH
jgi:hypothetical protein